jgi:hypothetical protein
MNSTPEAKSKKTKRPIAITIVGAIVLIVGIFNIASGALDISQGRIDFRLADEPLFENNQPSEYAVEVEEFGLPIVLGAIQVILGIAFLRLRRWAWVAIMFLVAFDLARDLIHYFRGLESDYIALGLEVLLVLALNQEEVQKIFGIRAANDGDLTQPSRNPIDG